MTATSAGGGRQVAMKVGVIAALLLSVVEVLTAYDDYEYFDALPGDPVNEVEIDFDNVVSKLQSNTPVPSSLHR